MRKLVATEYVTLDGVMEAPNEWSGPFWSDEAAAFKRDELFASDALLLGRVTYDLFAAAWPRVTDEVGFAERMNHLPKYVVSTTLSTAAWNNSTIIREDVIAAVRQLKAQPGQDILLAGSAALLNALRPHALIDEYRLMLHPVVVGKGKRLFADGIDPIALRLIAVKRFASGVVVLSYAPAAKEAGAA